MGYLKVIESSGYHWVCPKTATYKIICVSGGGNISNVNTPTTANHGGITSFGSYCTVSGCWGDGNMSNAHYSGNVQGYTLMDYSKIDSVTSDVASNIGYGAGIGGIKNGIGTLGKLKIAIADIKKDEDIVCTVGSGASASDGSKANDGVIIVQEIAEISEDDIGEQTPPAEFKVNFYRYDELYQTITIKENEVLTFPTVPLYNTDKYTGDVEHIGWDVGHSGNVIYKAGQNIYPSGSLNYFAVYKTKYKLASQITVGGPNLNIFNTSVTAKYSGSITCSCNNIKINTDQNTGQTTTENDSVSECVSNMADILINGVSIGTFGTKSVNEGDIITLQGSKSYVVRCTYPEFGYKNKS